MGLLSAGWIQFGRIQRDGHDVKVIWTGLPPNFWRQSRQVDHLALCSLDLVRIGWLMVNLILYVRADLGQPNMICTARLLAGWRRSRQR